MTDGKEGMSEHGGGGGGKCGGSHIKRTHVRSTLIRHYIVKGGRLKNKGRCGWDQEITQRPNGDLMFGMSGRSQSERPLR